MSTDLKLPAPAAKPKTATGIRRSLAALSLAATSVSGGALLGPSIVSAQASGSGYVNHCWFVADGSNGTTADWMSDYDLTGDAETTAAVATGTETLEAIVFHYPTGQMFATDGGQFGVIDLTPGATYGAFTPIGSGGLGDVDGLAFDSTTGNMWATSRESGADTLFRIDFNTGAQVGPTITIAPSTYSGPLNGGGSTVLNDIDDLAIDPVDGNFYAIANGAGALDMLVIIDPTDGTTSPVGSPADSGVQDIEGLGFTPSGQLIGTSGTSGGASANSIVDIDKADGTATIRNDALTHVDHEAVDCLTDAYLNPGVTIEKATNGQDADAAPGPYVAANGDVTWTYEITNSGNLPLFDLTLTDDVEGAISCTLPNPLLPGQSTTCTHTVTSAQAGQYTNIGSITGTPVDLVGLGYSIDPVSGAWLNPDGDPADFAGFDVAGSFPLNDVTADDPSHYFGSAPQIDIELATNGQDADTPTGPSVATGSTVTWTYVVTNPGNVPVSNVVVVDDNGTPGTPADDFSPTYVSGDTNGDGLLDTTETWIYTATGAATTGQYSNDATVDGTGPTGTPVEDADPTHHVGGEAGVDIEKATNGEDADGATGPVLPAGAPVTWTYVVTNTGNSPLTDVTITDDVEGPVCVIPTLAVGANDTCTLTGSATAGQYVNTGSVSATGPVGTVGDTDGSHHFGANPSIDIETSTNGDDADDTDGPTVPNGSTVTWTYDITNTGNVDLVDVVITDDLGGIVCTLPILRVGETATCELEGTADTGGVYENIGSVTGSPVDALGNPIQDPTTDQPMADVTDADPTHHNTVGVSTGTADLAIVKTIDGELIAGSNGTYVLSVDNLGPDTATGVTVVDVLPTGLTYNSVTGAGWTCSAVVQTVTCTRPSMAVGENVADIRISVSVAGNLGGQTVVNQATVDSDQSDPVISNNTSNVSVIGSNPVVQGTTSTTQSNSTNTTVRVKNSLPVTGSNAGNLALVASVLIAAGGLLIIPTRRRTTNG